MISYIPLSIRTSYSLLQSTIRISELIQLKFPSIGIVDQHNLFGAMDYNQQLYENKIHPITGCELTLNSKYKIYIYCQNELGYKNLCSIISNSYRDKEASVIFEDFENSNGLIAIAIPGVSCEQDDINKCADQMQKYFLNNWAIGIRNRENDEFHACAMSAIYKTPIIAVPEIRYIHQDQSEAYQSLNCIKHAKYLDSSYADDFHLPTSEEMLEEYKDWKEPLENTFLFAKKCSFILKKKKPTLPSFIEKDEDILLKNKAYEGLQTKINSKSDQYKTYCDRLEFELNTITKMGFDGYFLIVSDFINWAKENNIAVGPGRGSGAGSLVAYCIGITEVDPLKFGLVFERFLNPGRVSMPDFDIDFCPQGRFKVIEYITNKYGKEHVAHIITFGSMQSKGVLRDVGRILQVPYPIVDKHSKAIPVIQGKNLSLENYMKDNIELEEEMSQNDQVKKMFEISLKLEGLNRHASIHAAGIVIGEKELNKTLPLYKDHGITMTQFSLNHIEDAGLVKFDLLGLTALTIIKDTETIIRKNNASFLISKIKLNDQKTLDIFRNGYTVGIFQFESPGMTDAVVGLHPENFEDLIAVISLYRPGPMENIPTFIKRKHGELKTNYLFPEMEKTLKSTYGILVYQEQVLEIARNLAGYSMQEADLLRRAIGKKKLEEMKKHKIEFINRICKKMSSSEEDATELFEQIENFAKYAFVKAHATPYALIGYQTAYLKAHYSLEFFTASMILESNNTDKLSQFIYEAKRMGIKILPPDINKSNSEFSIEGNKIRFGFNAIKNVSINCIKEIIEKRPFNNISELLHKANINKKSIEHLIKSGTFDSLEPNRALMWSKRVDNHSIPSLFEVSNEKEITEWDSETISNYEFEAFGVYLNNHPLNKFQINKLRFQWGSQINNKEKDFKSIGKLEKIITKKSPKGDIYSICIISDPFGIWKCIYSEDNIISNLKGQTIYIQGEYKNKFIIASLLTNIDDKLMTTDRIVLKINNYDELKKLHKVIKNETIGKTEIMLKFEKENPLIIKKININTETLNKLKHFDYII